MPFPPEWQDDDDEHDAMIEARIHAQIAAFKTSNTGNEDALLAALEEMAPGEDVDSRQRSHERSLAVLHRDHTEALARYEQRTDRTRTFDGRIWDLLPPGTAPRSGDEVEGDGVWRPRQVIADYTTRYDRAVFERVAAQREYDADPTELARKRLEDAIRLQSDALRASDDETIQERDRIDTWRAGEGRDVYNASRRQVRAGPNANLKTMTDEEKAAHKREQARLRKQRSRGKPTV